MAYSKDKNLLFIHIPKNAGTAIITALELYPPGHLRWDQDPYLSDKVNSFTVVRNPWDRIVSCYEFAKMERSYWHSADGNALDGKHPDYDLCKSLSFKECVTYLYNNFQEFKHLGWQSQAQYVCDIEGDVKIKKLIKHETLSADLNAYLEECSLPPVELPPVNLSRPLGSSYREYYDDESRALIEHIYQYDINLFNYEY